MSELQHQTDIEQTKDKLREIEETKAGRKDPRGGELITRPPREPQKTSTDGKEIRPVTAKPKKKKFSQKIKEAMFSEDIGNGSVTEYVFFKIMIPSVKRVLSDMANTAINMALGLDPKTRTIRSGETHTANASLYRDRNYNRGYSSAEYNRREAISELEWDEETAKDIFGQMSELIERYGNCSIADAYSIMGLGDRIRTTDRNWGWTSMRNADVVPADRMEDRWYLDMPPARPLN